MERSITLYLREVRGQVRVDVGQVGWKARQLAALRRVAVWMAAALNECEHTPFSCATYTKTSRLRPCPTCRARAALGFRPVKGYQRRTKKNTKPPNPRSRRSEK